MKFNVGEWSELYVFLKLLNDRKLVIVDSSLKIIVDDIFEIIELILNDLRYKPTKDGLSIVGNSEEIKKFQLCDIKTNELLLLDILKNHEKSHGSFDVELIRNFIQELGVYKIKGRSQIKIDLSARVQDHKVNKVVDLSYSIKSNLGSKPTLLNSSSHTNFIYEVMNIDDSIMNNCNSYKTRTKLLDRFEYLTSNGAVISFVKTESEIFSHNLKMIDSKLDEILSNILLMSYQLNQKEIDVLLSNLIKDPKSQLFYQKKIRDFANAICFGMRAGEIWNGANEVNGGILVVTVAGDVYLLDLIYFKSEVEKYLINNIKLDSPSSKRYKMFEIYKENDKYYFKLNLQIRFK